MWSTHDGGTRHTTPLYSGVRSGYGALHQREGYMENGSYAGGILGAVGGILLALLAIFIGSNIARAVGGHHEPSAAHSAEH